MREQGEANEEGRKPGECSFLEAKLFHGGRQDTLCAVFLVS